MIGPGLKHVYVRKIGESCNVRGLVKAFVFKDLFYLFVCTFICVCLPVSLSRYLRRPERDVRSLGAVGTCGQPLHALSASESAVSTLNR